MATPNNITLGFLRLDAVEEGPSAGSSGWVEMSTVHLQPSDKFKSPDLAEALVFLLQDEGVGFRASYRSTDGDTLVKASVWPVDAAGSTWAACADKQYRAARERSLATVFAHLRRGDSGEDLVLNTAGIVGMTDLYASLPSPPDVSLGDRCWTGDHEVYSRLEGADDPRGLKTRLYRYQFRSVGKMLKMETSPGTLIDPTLVPLLAADGASTYYLDFRNWTVHATAPFYTLPRGGILCEQMGTGKTLMCLSLILSTLHQPCTPPADALDCSDAVTYHALHNWPFERYKALRQSAEIPEPEVSHVRPSLISLCAQLLARTDPTAVTASNVRAAVALDRRCVYLETPPEPPLMRRARKRYADRPAKQIWLANTTIVVVPAILVQQWREEIDKHIEPGALQTLIIGRKDPMPSTQKLMQLDIVLMSLERFSKEEQAESSPLEGARWKRIILDEGHIAGTRLSNAMVLARRLSVERRWLVSGTPTKHLQQGGEAQGSRTEASYWSKRDSDDIARIGNMISGFLEGKIWNGYATFHDIIVKPLLKRSPGALERLKYLMSSLMVKHAPGVIDTETTLPPTSVSTVMLDFHPMQRITYNVLAALVASNVYTSNFEDRDYFLHPSNTESFNQVVRNLHLACFWYTSSHMGAEDSLERTSSMLEDNRKISPEHRLKLEEACEHLQRALDTTGWSEWMTNGHSVAYEGSSLPPLIQTAWSDSMDTNPGVIDAVSLHALGQHNRRGRDLQQLHIAGWDFRIGKCQEALEQHRKDEKRFLGSSSSKPDKKVNKPPKSSTKGNAQGTKTAASAPSEIKKPRHSPRKHKESQATEVDDQIAEAARNARLQAAAAREDKRPRPLPDSITTCSRSSKINYVISTLLDADPSDKFVIFGHGGELDHLLESLILFDIPHCWLGSSLRPEALEEFKEPDKKVCLLDIRLAARGLNLVMANRMIILSPIWNPDVQAQAVKRIHRIGQTRPTEVQILVTKGTFEEDIAFRATTQRTQDEEKLYSRAMIENPRFVYDERLPDRHFEISLVPAVEAKKEAELAQYRREQQAITEAAMQSEQAEDQSDQLESPLDEAILTPAIIRPWGSISHAPGDEPESPLRNKRPRIRDAEADSPTSSTAPRRTLRWTTGADLDNGDTDSPQHIRDEETGSQIAVQVDEKPRVTEPARSRVRFA